MLRRMLSTVFFVPFVLVLYFSSAALSESALSESTGAVDEVEIGTSHAPESADAVEQIPANKTQAYPAVFSAKKDTDTTAQRFSSLASSETKSLEKARPTVGSGVVNADPVTVIAGLLVVVALIFIMAWLMRRMASSNLNLINRPSGF